MSERRPLRAICPQNACGRLGTLDGRTEMGLSSATDKQKEAGWRVEFDALGEQLVFGNAKEGASYNGEAKRQVGASLAF